MSVYMYQAALYCDECAELLPGAPDDSSEYDSDEYAISCPNPGEYDSPQHCDQCGRLLDCSLTEDGMEYVREAVRAFDENGDGDPQVIAEWREAFAYALA